jgi:hypothetical protein
LEYKEVLIVSNPEQGCEPNTKEHRLWQSGGELLVIAAPYREGTHCAKTPAEFEPIISELERLHEAGFVHGDIRGFNTVFTAVQGQGWLIDFDFGGKEDKPTTVYPDGYKKSLEDGVRPGIEKQRIRKWHDWRSLGYLIFQSHLFVPPPAGADRELEVNQMFAEKLWEQIDEANPPTPHMIAELKTSLSKAN